MKMFFEKEVLALVEMIDACYDEETGEFKEDDKSILDGLAQEEIAPCMERYKRASEYYKSQADLIAEEIKRLQARKKMFDNKTNRIRTKLLNGLNLLGGKFKTTFYTFSKRVTSSIDVNEELIDYSKLPNDCYKVKYEANKTAIKEHLDKGESFTGVTVKQTESLSVR